MASAKRERRDDIRKNSSNWFDRNHVLVMEYRIASERDFEENEMIDGAVKVTLRGKTFLVSKEVHDALGEEFLDLVLEDQGYWEAEERKDNE